MATDADLARILRELPEVEEGERHGHATWAVRGKGIAWLRPYSKADLKRFGDEVPPAEPILAVNTADLHAKEGVLAAGMAGLLVATRAGRIAPVSREMILNFVAMHSLGLPKSY